MIISFKNRGDFKETELFLKRIKKAKLLPILEKYAQRGVDALSNATPINTGKTASLWGYEIKPTSNGYSVYWTNDNINDGIPIVVLIQYGHGTRNGGYVEPIDFINPALKPILEELSNELWKEVIKQ